MQDNISCAEFFQVCKLTLGVQYKSICAKLHFLGLGTESGVQRNIRYPSQHWVCNI